MTGVYSADRYLRDVIGEVVVDKDVKRWIMS